MERNMNQMSRGEKNSSTYAEIYLEDGCEYHKSMKHDSSDVTEVNKHDDQVENGNEWVSPSDALMGIIDLKPPFTSKITRGKTHEGILAIGNNILEKQRQRFLKHVAELLSDNDKSWSQILANERNLVQSKVTHIYNNIFERKCKIMCAEMYKFYEKSLQELEDHMRSELNIVLTSAHANIISDSNQEITQKLSAERIIVENELQKRYTSEVAKINTYYKILLENEVQRYNKLINKALYERKDALMAFYKQIDAEKISATMYIMCTERKKCKIKQFILDNIQTIDVSEKIQMIKERQQILDAYKKREVPISQLNRDWEENIKKVVKLFLKFVSYSLKLLPEQTAFLLDLEKMIVLQMNEIQKNPKECSSILVEDVLSKNIFKFKETAPESLDCKNEPFHIIGDFSEPAPPRYGSRESLPDDVDLPFVRLDRQFIYAKCQKFKQIKEYLKSMQCECQDTQAKQGSDISVACNEPEIKVTQPSPPILDNQSLDEPLLFEDIGRIYHCPARTCQNWTERNEFPNLGSYLDFTENNYERVKTILGEPIIPVARPDMVDPNDITNYNLPFSATKESYHNIATQYSSQEELYVPEPECSCFDTTSVKGAGTWSGIKKSTNDEMNVIQQARKTSLRNIIQGNPTLLKFFTDECFDLH